MTQKPKICFRCHRPIAEDSNYYSFHEHNKKKIIHIDYAHRNCWDEFLKQVGNTDEAMSVLRGVKAKMQEIGFFPKEEAVIV